jgi:hypothetical protein
MKTLTLEDLTWKVEALPEDMPLEGNVMASGDDAQDREAEEIIRKDYESGNEWAWCVAKVTGSWMGLSHSTYLGGCSYKSKEDFCASGGYYDDMQAEILKEIQDKADLIYENLS